MAKINEEEVVKLFKEKNSVRVISKELKIKISTIYYILNKNEVPIINRTEFEDVLMEQLTKESKKGKSLQQLADEYNIEKTRLCRILNSYNLSDTKKQTIIILRQAGQGYSIIAQRLSITTEIVREVLRSFNINTKLRKSGLSREEILNARAKIERSIK